MAKEVKATLKMKVKGGQASAGRVQFLPGDGPADAGAGSQHQGKKQECGATPYLNRQLLEPPAGSSRMKVAPPSGRFSARRRPPSSVTMP